MSTATAASPLRREREILGQTVVAIGGSAGIGLETARRARAEGASVILTGRDPERLRRVAGELEVFSTAAFDATDATSLAVSIMHVALRCDGKGIVILSCPLRGLS